VRRAGVEARGDVVIGPTPWTILEYAERRNAALVVMATHGRTALSRLTMGSVATDVLTHTRRPLMLVRPELAADCVPLPEADPACRAGAHALPSAPGGVAG